MDLKDEVRTLCDLLRQPVSFGWGWIEVKVKEDFAGLDYSYGRHSVKLAMKFKPDSVTATKEVRKQLPKLFAESISGRVDIDYRNSTDSRRWPDSDTVVIIFRDDVELIDCLKTLRSVVGDLMGRLKKTTNYKPNAQRNPYALQRPIERVQTPQQVLEAFLRGRK